MQAMDGEHRGGEEDGKTGDWARFGPSGLFRMATRVRRVTTATAKPALIGPVRVPIVAILIVSLPTPFDELQNEPIPHTRTGDGAPLQYHYPIDRRWDH